MKKTATLIYAFLILHLSTGTCVSNGIYSTYVTCENNSLSLSCCNNTLIQITDVFYGRTDPFLCNNNEEICDINCTLENALNIVNNLCYNKFNCSLNATKTFFENPCNFTSSYLFVNYTCLATTTTKKTETIMGQLQYEQCGGIY